MENFSPWQVSEQTGHQEFNELFKTIPSVNFQSKGSGFNDSEIARGNDASRTSYSFNGILLNNPETGQATIAFIWFDGLVRANSGREWTGFQPAKPNQLWRTPRFTPRHS